MATITGPLARVASQILDHVNTIEDWRVINDIMKSKFKTIQKATLHQFKIGDWVEWDIKYDDKPIEGKIIKINTKTIIVSIEIDGRQVSWKVSPSFLRKTALNVA